MRKRIFIYLTLFLLTACRNDIIPIDVQRSTIYCGQSVVSLFDNFGVPSKQHINNWGQREYHYYHQRFMKRGLDNYIFYCDFIVYTNDGFVENWQFRGNNCAIETLEPDWIFIPHEL